MEDRRAILAEKHNRIQLAGSRNIFYWSIRRNRAVGYRRRSNQGKWFAMVRLRDGSVKQKCLGLADDDNLTKTEGISFTLAVSRAEAWFEKYEEVAAPDRRQYEYDEPFPGLPSAPPYTVAHAGRDYFLWYRSHRQGLDRTFAVINRHILPRLGHIQLDRLKPKHIIDWHIKMAEGPPIAYSGYITGVVHGPIPVDPEGIRKRRNTANTILGILKSILNRAYDSGYVETNWAWANVRAFKNARHKAKPDFLSKESIVRLVDAAEPKIANMIKAGLFTGCRVGNILSMQVQDYLKPLKRIIVFEHKTQNLHHIALSEEAIEFFDNLTEGRSPEEAMFIDPEGRPWTRYRYRIGFLKAQEEAGFKERISYHTLRHTYASHAAMARIPLKLIANQLGHRSVQMVDRYYAHLSSDYADEEIRALMPNLISD